MYVLLLLAACDDSKVGIEDTDVALADLGDPFVGLYAAASPGTFRTDCDIDVALYEGDELVASSSILAVGGEWTGTALPGDVLYRAVATWESCTTGPDGYGSFESSAFSGVRGDLFLFHYNGVMAAFDSLVQREDFEGGVADVTFAEGTSEEDVQAAAATHGVDLTLTSGTTYRASWTGPTAVGKVLSDLSTERYYAYGGPVWIRTPDWW